MNLRSFTSALTSGMGTKVIMCRFRESCIRMMIFINHNSSEKKILNLNIVYGFSVVIIGLYLLDDDSIKIDENDRNE